MGKVRGQWLHDQPYRRGLGWECSVMWVGEERFVEQFRIYVQGESEMGCITRAHQVISGLSRVDQDAFGK